MPPSAAEPRQVAMEAAQRIVAERYPSARSAFVGGSIIRGEGTPRSDIDLVIVFDRVEAAWRESYRAQGFPVETFVHDPETLDWFIASDIASGRPAIVQMIAEGEPLGLDHAAAIALKLRAAALLDDGPPPLEGARLDELRYRITDLCDDLADARPLGELRAVGAALYQPLADLILLGRRRWTGSGKWVPRLIGRTDSALLAAFDDAFAANFNGDARPLLKLASQELDRHGGAHFEGDRRVAPTHARRV